MTTVYKCDKCKKIIRDHNHAIHAGFGWLLDNMQLCASCGEPIKKILQEYGYTRRGYGNE